MSVIFLSLTYYETQNSSNTIPIYLQFLLKGLLLMYICLCMVIQTYDQFLINLDQIIFELVNDIKLF
jgi:hypothetical protein